MKTKLLFILLIITTLIIGACNPLMPFNSETASVSIDTGLKVSTDGSKGISDVASFKLTVTAEEMTTIEKSFTDESIDLEIEAGPARTFKLEALDSAQNVIFSGTSAVNLTAGETVDVVIEMETAGFYVTFNSNGGLSIPVLYVPDGGKIIEPNQPTKTGFGFDGWYADAGLTTTWDFSQDTVDSSLTLYAKWFSAAAVTGVALNNATLVLTNSNLAELSATIEPADALNKTLIWSSSNTSVLTINGTGETPILTVQGSGVTTITVETIDGGYTDSCIVTVDLFTVTYFANGGSGTVPEDTNDYLLNSSATVLENTLSNGSLIFQSWNTQSDGNGTNYFYNQSLPVIGNIELYAIWVSDDHANDYSSATSVSSTSNTPGNIQYEGDVDYFQISVPSAGQLVLDSNGGVTDVTGTLYDTDGTTQLAYNDDTSGLMFEVDYMIPAAGVYYFKVAGFSTNIGTYTLNVSFTP